MQTTRFEIPVDYAPAAATVATMNFVGYIDHEQHHDAIMKRAEALVAKHPSRLILLDATADGTLEPKQAAEFLASAVLRNLPTVLWWASRAPLPRALSAALASFVSDVVVDSGRSRNDATAVSDLAAIHHEFPRMSLHDLAWLRTRPWRDAIAKIFDHAAAQEHVGAIRTIEISGGARAEAQYIAGWLASRLGWIALDQAHFQARDGRAVRFSYAQTLHRRPLYEIRLACTAANFRIAVDERAALITCFSQVDAAQMSTRHEPFRQADDTELIELALFTRGTDELFDASLRSVHLEG